MNTIWPAELKAESKNNVVIIHLPTSFHLEHTQNNPFFGVALMIMGFIGTIAILVEYFHSLLSLLSFVTVIFIWIGIRQMGDKDKRVKTMEITDNEIKLDCGRQGVYSYFIADIKQFYVRSNGDLYAILEDFGHEKHIIFLRGLPPKTAFALAEALETYLDIYDIAVANEIRV